MWVNVCNFQIWPKYARRWALWTLSDYIPWWSHCQRTQCSTQSNANVPLILLTHSRCVEAEGVGESPGQVRHCTPLPRWDLIEETSTWYKVELLGSLWHQYMTSVKKQQQKKTTWSAAYKSEKQDCECGGAEEEEANLNTSLRLTWDLQLHLIHRCLTWGPRTSEMTHSVWFQHRLFYCLQINKKIVFLFFCYLAICSTALASVETKSY